MNTLEREIEFRGKDENGKWWYGGYYTLPDGEGGSIHRIAANCCTNEKFEFHDIVVKPETVGEFTGLTDNKGKEIYEGDIVLWTAKWLGVIKAVVYYDDECGSFGIRTDRTETIFRLKMFHELEIGDIEVIGNIFDNPELLKKEEK